MTKVDELRFLLDKFEDASFESGYHYKEETDSAPYLKAVKSRKSLRDKLIAGIEQLRKETNDAMVQKV